MSLFFFFNDTATTEIYTLSLHDALPIFAQAAAELFPGERGPLFLGGHPMAGRELPGITHADADLFRENTYALIAKSPEPVVAGGLTPSFFPPPRRGGPLGFPLFGFFLKFYKKR